jgi:GalNAc-alpha-(1->4)-GalNAc-alpha-(1->3)-diNAcBac-PP-undecaprenol alpha-1,4-N-acetyl-D-galactosaminyltransferase
MRGKISTIYNGVDLEVFRPEIKLENRINENLKLLVLSSIVPNKNAMGLVSALGKYIKDYSENCSVHWAGKIGDNSLAHLEFNRVNLLIKDLNLDDHWEWMGERRDVPQLLKSHDVLIHPSFYEGLPNAICEALACGLPVLASDVGDNGCLVKDGISGFLFNPYDPSDIAQTIHRFVGLSGEDRVHMSLAARTFAEKELSLDICSAHYESLFNSMIKGE